MDGYVNKSGERTCNMKMKKKKMDHRQGTPPSREILKKKKKKSERNSRRSIAVSFANDKKINK